MLAKVRKGLFHLRPGFGTGDRQELVVGGGAKINRFSQIHVGVRNTHPNLYGTPHLQNFIFVWLIFL